LAPFPESKEARTDTRSLALAWASLAERGLDAAKPIAARMLREQVKRAPKDAAMLSALGWVEQSEGNREKAEALYSQSLEADRWQLDAAASLGELEVERGAVREGVRRWMDVFERAPQRTDVAVNVTRAFCAAGLVKEAQGVLQRGLEFNPDSREAREARRKLEMNPPECR
jgi:tetratricopeptide (TPR) repeat protein